MQFKDDEMRLRQFHAAKQPLPLPSPPLELAEPRFEELSEDATDEVAQREDSKENIDPARALPAGKAPFEFAPAGRPAAPSPSCAGAAGPARPCRRKLRNAPCKRRATEAELGVLSAGASLETVELGLVC